MPPRLYLDAARLGLISPTAQRAQRDFVRLANEEGCWLYFEEFLREGFAGWPEELRQCFPGLASWGGVGELKDALRRTAGVESGGVLLAGRSAQLVKLAARLLLLCCRRVLLTDLAWPAYRRLLESERQRRRRGRLFEVPLQAPILGQHATPDVVVARIVNQYCRERCDGLFLPAVSHHGIRLPVADICRALRAIRPPKLVVVDGAQGLAHVPIAAEIECSHLLVTGCHKWLGGHHPLGVAFAAPDQTPFVNTVAKEMMLTGELDDPLLNFTRELEGDSLEPYSETVNLTPLFTCRGALCDAATPAFSLRCRNREMLARIATKSGWRPIQPHEQLRSGILLLEPPGRIARPLDANGIRRWFQSFGITVSVFQEGLVRVSMPDRAWTNKQLTMLQEAFGATPADATATVSVEGLRAGIVDADYPAVGEAGGAVPTS